MSYTKNTTTQRLPKGLEVLRGLKNKYLKNDDPTLNVCLDITPLDDIEKTFVVEALSYQYTSIFLQIGGLIQKSNTNSISKSAKFISGLKDDQGAQCNKKTVDRFTRDTNGVLINVEKQYTLREGKWVNAANRISLTKFGIETYLFLYENFISKTTRVVRKKGEWRKTFERRKKEARSSFHKRKTSIKKTFQDHSFKFSQSVNSVHKWYCSTFSWGKKKLQEVYRQLTKKNVPQVTKKMTQQENRNLRERKLEELLSFSSSFKQQKVLKSLRI